MKESCHLLTKAVSDKTRPDLTLKDVLNCVRYNCIIVSILAAPNCSLASLKHSCNILQPGESTSRVWKQSYLNLSHRCEETLWAKTAVPQIHIPSDGPTRWNVGNLVLNLAIKLYRATSLEHVWNNNFDFNGREIICNTTVKLSAQGVVRTEKDSSSQITSNNNVPPIWKLRQ